MEYGSDGQIKVPAVAVKPQPAAPLTVQQQIAALEARVAKLEAAQSTAAPAVEEAKEA